MNRPGEDTLIRYFRGECLPDEAAAVQLYLAMNIDADYVQQCLREAWGDLEEAPAHTMSGDVLEERWKQLETSRSAPVHHLNKRARRLPFLRYAAAVVLLLASVFTVLQLNSHKTDRSTVTTASFQSFSTPKGKMRQLTLADGSVIMLFPGSEIQVANDFNQHERTVLLKGRAFFEVAQNVQHPFYVKTTNLITKVLGTAFDVDASRHDATSKIILLNGRISVSNATQQLATLNPGQQVVFDSITRQWQVSAVNAKDAMAWTSGEFIYEHAPLQQVFRDIERWYDVTIQVGHPSILTKEITTNFKGLQLEQVLTIISKALKLHYQVNGKKVIVVKSMR